MDLQPWIERRRSPDNRWIDRRIELIIGNLLRIGVLLSACVVFGVAGLYCVWSWTGGRRTLSMKTWRLWLVRRDGATVDSRTAVIRYLALWIGPAAALVAYEALKASGLGKFAVWLVLLNYAWALVDPDRQFLHDRVARTRIVRSSAATVPSAG